MFNYEDKEFYANSLSHAYTKFLDEAWGTHYVDYLKQNNLEYKKIYAINDIEEVEDIYDGYYKLKQKLENGAIFQIEVWGNEDGSYDGLAQVI
ncbi:hypothetical protein [Enterococcus olivae]